MFNKTITFVTVLTVYRPRGVAGGVGEGTGAAATDSRVHGAGK